MRKMDKGGSEDDAPARQIDRHARPPRASALLAASVVPARNRHLIGSQGEERVRSELVNTSDLA